MKKLNSRHLTWMAALALLLSFSACSKYEGDVHVPAYLHLDRMEVVNDPSHSWSPYSGFFSSDIDGVNIEVWFEGENATTQLGTYQLPCTVPILHYGKIQKVNLYPIIKIDGTAGMRGYYYFYQYATLTDLPLSPDSITNLGLPVVNTTGDTEWVQTVKYTPNMKVLVSEFFEPNQGTTNFDSVVVKVDDSEGACSGYGYGYVHASPDQNVVHFEFKKGFEIEEEYVPTLYLEMDYHTDQYLNIGMRAAYTQGGSTDTKSIMVLFPNEDWQKIYISLGKVWSQFNHNTNFDILFDVLNDDRKDCHVYLDNVKVVAL